jgi:hypothetical protein
MASIRSRKSVLAVVEETTEGTIKAPTASTDYVALQDAAFTITPAFENLENAELRASIGTSKPIVGAEAPSASLTHYMRASGVEGQAPNFSPLLKAAFGSVATLGTEYDTVSSSTTSLIKVNTGEGVNFTRGKSLLIKDTTNGYRVRFVKSRSSDDLTIGFNLPNAPASGVNLGKYVSYSPADTGHPSLSIWHYLGNEGAIAAMAGARVTNTSITIDANQLMTLGFDLEGIKYFFNPIAVVTGSNSITYDIGGGDVTVTVPLKTYETPQELASAVTTALTAAAVTCTYDNDTGKFSVTKASGTLAIDWLTGSNSIGATLGFTADDTGALTYVADVAQDFSSPQDPTFDNSDPLVAKDNEVMLGLAAEYACFKASSVSVTIGTPKADVLSVCSTSGKDGSIVTQRTVEMSITGLLNQYDARLVDRLRNGTEIGFQYTAGKKTGGNWIPGTVVGIYSPTCRITDFETGDADGLVIATITLSAFVNNSGEGEIYMGMN